MAAREKASAVKVIHLEIGELSCVADRALLFAFEVARVGTVAEEAELAIRRHPVTVRCQPCRREVVLESAQLLKCPVCGTPSNDIVSGRELEVSRIEVEV